MSKINESDKSPKWKGNVTTDRSLTAHRVALRLSLVALVAPKSAFLTSGPSSPAATASETCLYTLAALRSPFRNPESMFLTVGECSMSAGPALRGLPAPTIPVSIIAVEAK